MNHDKRESLRDRSFNCCPFAQNSDAPFLRAGGGNNWRIKERFTEICGLGIIKSSITVLVRHKFEFIDELFCCKLSQWTRKIQIENQKMIENFFSFTDGGLGAGTITSRWPPVGAGPTLGPADTNGAGVDAKHLDVGDMSDVSDVS